MEGLDCTCISVGRLPSLWKALIAPVSLLGNNSSLQQALIASVPLISVGQLPSLRKALIVTVSLLGGSPVYVRP